MVAVFDGTIADLRAVARDSRKAPLTTRRPLEGVADALVRRLLASSVAIFATHEARVVVHAGRPGVPTRESRSVP
jgi:hypothetical protein